MSNASIVMQHSNPRHFSSNVQYKVSVVGIVKEINGQPIKKEI
jgi:hypothetical protein